MSQPIDTQRDRLESQALQTAILRELGDRLLQIEEHLAAQEPVGVVEPESSLSITSSRKTVYAPQGKKWFSVTFVNDGANRVWCQVNSSVNAHPIGAGETYDVDFPTGVIKKVVLWCDSGNTSTVRMSNTR